jgi:4a-hydroxytetrahydrobiopterin dehydratase
VALLSDQEITERLVGSGWQRDGDTIVRDYKLTDFVAALRFVNDVGAIAEDLNHHPDILIHGWNKVRLTVSTHSEGGVTAADFGLAGRVDELG